MTTQPLEIPEDCESQWSDTVTLCPNCQDKYLRKARLNDGVEQFKTHHYECGKCGHWERK